MTRPEFLCLLAAAACLFSAVAAAQEGPRAATQATSAPVRITVSGEVLNPVSDELFGQFMERAYGGELGAEAGVDQGTGKLQPEVEKLLAGMRIPLVRFPGGTAVDYREWTEMVDSIPGRQGPRPTTKVKDPRDSNVVREYNNRFGYDEYLRLAEKNGWASDIVLNFHDGLFGVAPLEQAVAHQAKLVAYCNAAVDANLPAELLEYAKLRAANGHRQPYGVKYFQIGNETWYWEDGVKKIEPNDPVGHWVKCLGAYVKMIRSIDPNARIIVDALPVAVAETMHKDFGGEIYAYAWHKYVPSRIQDIRKDGNLVDMSALSARDMWNAWVACPLIDADGESTLKDQWFDRAKGLGRIAMTEWNWNGGYWGRKDAVPLDSLLAKGVGVGGFLNAIMRQGGSIVLGMQSMLVGCGWDIAAIHADPNAKEPPYMGPMAMATMLYSQHHGSRRLAATLENMPFFAQPYDINMLAPKKVAVLDVVCTRNDKAVFVHMVNREFEKDVAVEVDVSALGAAGKEATMHAMTGRLENAAKPGEPRCPTRIDDAAVPVRAGKVALDLPCRSVSVLEIPLE